MRVEPKNKLLVSKKVEKDRECETSLLGTVRD
jgi:hypothetical protein